MLSAEVFSDALCLRVPCLEAMMSRSHVDDLGVRGNLRSEDRSCAEIKIHGVSPNLQTKLRLLHVI